MNKYKMASLAAAAGIAGCAAQAATLGKNATAYALGQEGTTLVTVASANNAAPSALSLDFGGDFVTLDSIAYRPMTGTLYGYDNEFDTVYTIDTRTGATTAVASRPELSMSDDIGFDFNNVLDAARIVTAEDENRVYFPNNPSGSEFVFATDLFIAPGDPNEGLDPNVVANAYTNAVANATTTSQFILDSDWNILGTLANNAGTIMTVGDLYFEGEAFDMTEDAGFDILSFFEGDNTAYALLTEAGTGFQGIYEVPLVADSMGRINLSLITAAPTGFGTLDAFAVVPSAIPLPATLPLLGGALLLFGFGRRALRKG